MALCIMLIYRLNLLHMTKIHMLSATIYCNICSIHTQLIGILLNKKLYTGPMHKRDILMIQSIKHIETMLSECQANNSITLYGIQDN